MLCYECSQSGRRSEAVGICHHCSAALCASHAQTIDDPVTARYPVARTVTLPLRARLLLCETCASALRQKPEPARVAVGVTISEPRPSSRS
jgi:hypothetical protein